MMYRFFPETGVIIDTSDDTPVSLTYQYQITPHTLLRQLDGMKMEIGERLDLTLGRCNIFYTLDGVTPITRWEGDIILVHWTGKKTHVFVIDLCEHLEGEDFDD